MSEYVTNANTSSNEMSSIIQSSGLIQSSFSSNNNILEENIQMRQAINHVGLRYTLSFIIIIMFYCNVWAIKPFVKTFKNKFSRC